MAELMSENDDNELNKLPKHIKKVNLFLQMPDEQFGEVIRDFEATFFDVSDQSHQAPLQQTL
jgi:hypothetical protein